MPLFVPPETLRDVITENPIKWVASGTAGITPYLIPELINSDIQFTKAQDAFSWSLGEYAVTAMLYFTKSFPTIVEYQQKRATELPRFNSMSGKTLLIIGYGSIGQAVAKRASAFEMNIIGIKRRVTQTSDEYANEIHPMSELHSLLPRSDYVVMALPLVQDTMNVISATELQLMKPSSILINLGRGDSLNEDDVATALSNGQIAGAALDVFKTEPLPEESKLWTCPNLLLSPHNADFVPTMMDDFVALFKQNLDRYLAGEELMWKVDKSVGY
jgi:phosphoglycerate dehydrogenase-like enzyme